MTNPLDEYHSLVRYRQEHPLPPGEYGEKHHIVPKCVGGPEKAAWNIVRLTVQEHFKAHSLLPLIYTEGKAHTALVFAWNLIKTRITEIDTESPEYKILNRELSERRHRRLK